LLLLLLSREGGVRKEDLNAVRCWNKMEAFRCGGVQQFVGWLCSRSDDGRTKDERVIVTCADSQQWFEFFVLFHVQKVFWMTVYYSTAATNCS